MLYFMINQFAHDISPSAFGLLQYSL